MKCRLFLVALCSLMSLLVAPKLIANTEIVSTDEVDSQTQETAISYLNKMKQAYTQLNYELVYLNTAQNQIEPKRLIHGVVDGKRIAYFSFLNGAMRETLQFDGKISFYQQGNQAYSFATQRDQSIFANIANFDFVKGNKSYEYIVIGKGRIAGKKAIAIRMISKDNYRYSYIVWLDLNSYLPLRLDVINKSNLILEQTMVVSLITSDQINPWLKQLSTQTKPEVLHLVTATAKVAQWDVDWLPKGFEIVKGDQHKLMMHDTDPVSYIMLDDGISLVSIYISNVKTRLAEQQRVIKRGGTLIYTKQQDNVEVNIIGQIPLETAERIAASIKPVR